MTNSKEGYSAKDIRGRVLATAVSGDLAYASAPRALLSGALNLGQLDLNQPELKAFESAARESRPRDVAGAGAPAWSRGVEADLSLRIAGITGLPVPARNLSSRVRWRDDVVHLQGLAATLAGTDVTGEGTLRWRDDLPQIDGKVSIAVLDFAKLDGSAAQRGKRSAFDEPLPLAPLRSFDARLDVDVARIAGAPVPIGKLAALAYLRSGKLAIDLTSATVANAQLQGHVTVDASGRAWRVDADEGRPPRRGDAASRAESAGHGARRDPGAASPVRLAGHERARTHEAGQALRSHRSLHPCGGARPLPGPGAAGQHRGRAGRPGARARRAMRSARR